MKQVGYDNNERFWIIKNSWGTSWADGGFAKVICIRPVPQILHIPPHTRPRLPFPRVHVAPFAHALVHVCVCGGGGDVRPVDHDSTQYFHSCSQQSTDRPAMGPLPAMRAHTHTHTHIYIHTHIHTHTNKQTNKHTNKHPHTLGHTQVRYGLMSMMDPLDTFGGEHSPTRPPGRPAVGATRPKLAAGPNPGPRAAGPAANVPARVFSRQSHHRPPVCPDP
jgi:hypothetical protein